MLPTDRAFSMIRLCIARVLAFQAYVFTFRFGVLKGWGLARGKLPLQNIWVFVVEFFCIWEWHFLAGTGLRNEAAYARHYKYMAAMPLLHDTHLPLAELRTTYSQTNTLKFAYIMGITAHWATSEWGLSADCELSYQPLRSRKKRKKERKKERGL